MLGLRRMGTRIETCISTGQIFCELCRQLQDKHRKRTGVMKLFDDEISKRVKQRDRKCLILIK